MDLGLSDRQALVTGAATGVGLAVTAVIDGGLVTTL
jgi:NAD(P)-dependent dehydrogenase (short-subunit alcohol dehydrogenase family)